MERTMATIDLQEPDRVAASPWQGGWATRLIDRKWIEHSNDPQVHAESQLAAYEICKLDGVNVNIGIPVVPGAIGCPVDEPEDDFPKVQGHIVHSVDDVNKLKLPDPEKDGFMPTMLGAIRILKRQLKDEVPVWSATSAPWQVAGNLRGLQEWFVDSIMNPELIDKTLEFCGKAVSIWAEAMIDAGADILFIGDSLATGDLISVDDYKKWARPYEREIIQLAHNKGAKVILHICGRTSDRWEEMLETGADLFDLDAPIDMAAAKQQLGDRICIKGNIDTTLMVRGTPEDIEQISKKLVEGCAPGGGFILGSGCELGRDTPVENVQMMAEVVRKYGWYDGNES
ncbi:MAG: uroporphyrinogen decarboxylase family protein [Candidatus Bipolaricaulia bacterium]